MKISFKIAILVGILSFLISMSVGHYANNFSSNKLQKDSGESLLKLSKNVADILDREMLERYREIEFAASLSPLIDKNSTKEERRVFIEKIKGKHQHHEWIGFALPDGTVDVGTNGYLENKNVKARPWLPGGLKGPYIGDVHDALLLAKLLPNNSGEAIYFTDVAFPVKDKEGDTLGVLCTHLKWQWTRNVVRSIQKEHGVEIYLLSKDGMILVGPNKTERMNISKISQNVTNIFNQNRDVYKFMEWKPGEKYLTAFITSKGFEEYKGFGWKVIVRQNLDDALKEVKNNANQILIISIIFGLIGTLLGIFITSRITASLNRLKDKVVAFSKGEKEIFEYSNSQDEISILENQLKDLSEKLKAENRLKIIAEEKVDISLRVFDQSLEGILITNKDNQIILINNAFTNITGYTLDDVYLKDPSILASKKQPADFYENMWRSIKENEKWEGVLTNKRKDGSYYDESLRISVLKDNHGNIINYVATFSSAF